MAAAAWAGAAAGFEAPVWAAVPLVAALVARRPLLVAVVAVACVSGVAAAQRSRTTLEAPIPSGRIAVAGVAVADPSAGRDGVRFLLAPEAIRSESVWVAWRGPRLLVEAAEASVEAGDRVAVEGTAVPGSFLVRGDPVAGAIAARSVEVVGGPSNPFWIAGNRVRARVRDGLAPWWPRPAAVLVAGFLTGDVAELPPVDAEVLRRAGLSHFVAVSGSNVALFLMGLFVVLGPLAWGPRRRSALGLLGLGVFLVATRWEPSVVRASTMAAIVLTARLGGFTLDAWTALGTAVTALVVVSPELSVDLGFQLSAAATAGVLAGARLLDGRRPRWLWTALAASLAAQAAVAPILLLRIGSVPSAGPLANPVAAPVVAAATILGGAGTMLGLPFLSGIAVAVAGRVLDIARIVAPLPELDVAGVAGAAVAAVAVAAMPRTRPAVAVAAVVVLGLSLVPQPVPEGPELTVLDVGQGDAILLRGPSGEVILVDGGPDPVVLAAALRRRGVRRVDLLVATHRHADHTTGLAGVVPGLDVQRFWHPGLPGAGEPLDRIAGELAGRGVPVETPAPGTTATVGAFGVEVLGPRRRYVSPNDGSIVLLVTASGRSALLSGDIETYAQADIGPVRADILKVPHQGAATSDPGWLAASAGVIAIVSVGPNDFGHPSPDVMKTLEGAGSTVLRTDRDGDVVVRFDRLPAPLPSAP